MDIVIKNGIIVNSMGTMRADIGIEGDTIVAIGEGLHASVEIDAKGQPVTPGGVDIHTHLQYHVGDWDTADSFATGTLAAAFGGTTTVMDFVEAKPEETLLAALERRQQQAAEQAYIDYSLHMSITPSDLSKLEQVPQVLQAGCPTFKHYMAYGFCLSQDQLYDSFEAIGRAGGMAIVHAENWPIICKLIAKSLNQGRTHARNHPRCRPAELEGQAIAAAGSIAKLTNTDLFIFHITCGEGAEQLSIMRNAGQRVWGETCPHYLCLNSEIFEQLGNLAICSPPIREKEQAQRLLQAVISGTISSISTDHCPFTKAQKFSKTKFNEVPGGLSSIETRLMLVSSLPGITPERWVDACCTQPARLMGLTQKGSLAPGYHADIVIWNPSGKLTFSTETLHEQADWTPYEGWQVTSVPETVLSRGQVIIQNGQALGKPGRGQYQPRFLDN